jgi:hypothetical protein
MQNHHCENRSDSCQPAYAQLSSCQRSLNISLHCIALSTPLIYLIYKLFSLGEEVKDDKRIKRSEAADTESSGDRRNITASASVSVSTSTSGHLSPLHHEL